MRLGLTLAGLLLLATPALAREAMPVAVTTDRFIAIDGGHNFRDTGGYRSSSGRSVRRGVFYRSASMANLTPSGMAQLAGAACRLDHRSALDTGAPRRLEQLARHVGTGLLGARL